jgi:hypothetical protein
MPARPRRAGRAAVAHIVGALRASRSRLALVRRPLSPLEQLYEEIELGQLETQFEEAAAAPEDKHVSASSLLVAATLHTPQFRVAMEKRQLAYRWYEPLRVRFQKENPGLITAIIAPHAIVRMKIEPRAPTGQPGGIPGRFARRVRLWFGGGRATEPETVKTLSISLSPHGAPDFNWSEARALLNRCDALGDRAKLWVHEVQEQGPHVERGYGLATQILAAVQRERWRRQELRIGPDRAPTPGFLEELHVMSAEVERAERLFLRSAEQSAQALYFGGMLRGALGVALFSAVGGWLLYYFGLRAAIGVAFPAGALGAAISVTQRMHSGDLTIDFRAPASRLRLFGGIRLVLGAVLGVVLFAIVESGQLLPAIKLPTRIGPELAFFGVLGFLAGFNERFAQDVVTTSSERLRTAFAAGAPGASTRPPPP